MLKKPLLLLVIILLLFSLSPTGTVQNAAADAPAQNNSAILTFTDGYGGNVFTAQDNLLNSNPGAQFYNLGQHENFEIANYTGSAPSQVALLRFNLSSIPAEAKVVSATLYLYKSYRQGDGGGTITAKVYSVTQMNRDWVAGRGDLEPSLPGESCWAAKACSGSNGTIAHWAGSAGLGTAKVDYETPEMGSRTWTPSDDPLGQEYAISLSAGRVACWFGQNNSNYGIVIKNTTAGSDHQGQSEHTNTTLRPKLVVRYTLDENGGIPCGGSGGGGENLPFKFYLPNLNNQYRP